MGITPELLRRTTAQVSGSETRPLQNDVAVSRRHVIGHLTIQEKTMQLKKGFRWAASLASLAIAVTAHAGALTTPYAVSTGQQQMPVEVSAGTNGDQLILFSDEVDARYKLRYDSNGAPLTTDKEALGAGFGDSIAADRVGNHVVLGTVSGLPGIYARVYNRAGAIITPQFRTDENTGGTQANAVVAMNSNGVIAAAWSSYYSTLSTQYVQIRLFNRDGTPRSGMMAVASSADQYISPTSIAIDGNNNVTVVWQQRNYATPIGFNVWMRRYNGTGAALTNAIKMNDSSDQALFPHVGTNTAGTLVATWSTYAPSTNSRVIMGQRYDS
ncbi:MAG TPA: hypothetical protein VGQ93_03260, partial [Lysobacter sp.]|nr:hypothetical protein [Lysobacter sp.]